ncbi:PPR repeat [Novymonas esmeraldas]|uniref:PPR repeat n=1 Tax=Novymonas esmeraldas TaxID=1808958 RepID=A0AAW0ETH6_9TRYP
MPLPPQGPVSGLAAVARVVLDTAQRVGALEPLQQSRKEYTQELRKMQEQSKKRGGSLGGVSYKVAEFVAAQRPPAAEQVRPVTPLRPRTIARKVPLIDLPSLSPRAPTPARASAPSKNAGPTASPTPLLNLQLTKSSALRKEEAARSPSPSPLSPSLSPRPVPPVPAVTAEPEPAMPAASPHVEEVLITEDKPLFEVRQHVTSDAVVPPTVVTSMKPQETIPQSRKMKPVISMPIAAESSVVEDTATEAAWGVAAPAAGTVEELSVDVWEQQRERELERLQKSQEEEERRRLILVREAEHRTLGKEWVALRTRRAGRVVESAAGGKLLREVAAADSAAAALTAFQKMIDAGSRASSLLPAGLASVASRIRFASPVERLDLGHALLDVMEKAKQPDHLVRRARLLVSTGEGFLAAFDSLTATERRQLDSTLILKSLRSLVSQVRWEEALELAKQCRSNFRSGSDAVDLALLQSCHSLEEGPRKAVTEYASRSLTESGRMGRQAKLLVAKAERGAYRRTLLKQLTASSDVDEGVYAALIIRSDADQTAPLLAEMAARGLNKEDPVVLGAVAMKTINEDDPDGAFKEIARQVAASGLQSAHVIVAAKMAALHPTEDVFHQASAVVQMAPPLARAKGMRKLLPVLYEHNMFDEIVRLADATDASAPLVKLIPRAVAFVNEALVRVGRTPLSELRASDIGFSPRQSSSSSSSSSNSAAEGFSSRVREQPAVALADLAGLTEKMLMYAKERQWVKAVEAVSGLPAAIKADASAVTLLYNCALSAAVDRPETVKEVYALMRSRQVAANATTANTVLSSLSKSSFWEEALDLFDTTPLAQRDNNTYLIYFALLGRQGLWERAAEVYGEMRTAVAKSPVAMFSLVIGTTGSHDWQTTLQVFQDMLKVHGAGVKDSVVTQVIRSLEQNGKTGEIAKLEKELAKRRKKKK